MTEAMPFLQKYDITFLRPPTIHERAAHIAERAMPVCKGMAKLYPMIYKNVNTVFERILK